jgi:hypothetical protein
MRELELQSLVRIFDRQKQGPKSLGVNVKLLKIFSPKKWRF